jgi:hypothetical protein
MAFVEDLTGFLADFGIAATVGATAVTVIYDTDYGDPMGLIAGSRTVITCISSQVSAADVGTAVSIGATSYTVAEVQPDGTGITRLVLERV